MEQARVLGSSSAAAPCSEANKNALSSDLSGKDVESDAAGGRECRICLQNDRQDQLCTPCGCSGTMQFTHADCLTSWIKERRSSTCELCHREYAEPFKSILADYIRQCPVNSYDRPSPFVGMGREHERLAGSGGSWRSFWCHVIILSILLGAIVYLTCFSPIMDSGAGWTAIMWRVLTVIIPVYIVGRIGWALYMRWKLEHALAAVATAAAQARALQEQEEQEEQQQQQQQRRAVAVPQDNDLRSIVVTSPAADSNQQLGVSTGTSAANAAPHVVHVQMSPRRQQQQQQQQGRQQQ